MPATVVWCRGPFAWAGCEGETHYYRCRACGGRASSIQGDKTPEGHRREVYQPAPKEPQT